MSKVEHLDSTVLTGGGARTPDACSAGFAVDGSGNPERVTAMTTRQELVLFPEDRLACARVCAECARACALRVSRSEPDATDHEAPVRHKVLLCAQVFDGQPGAGADAEACRDCARACTEFMATLNWRASVPS